jgi:hypothetical protein
MSPLQLPLPAGVRCAASFLETDGDIDKNNLKNGRVCDGSGGEDDWSA